MKKSQKLEVYLFWQLVSRLLELMYTLVFVNQISRCIFAHCIVLISVLLFFTGNYSNNDNTSSCYTHHLLAKVPQKNYLIYAIGNFFRILWKKKGLLRLGLFFIMKIWKGKVIHNRKNMKYNTYLLVYKHNLLQIM